MTDPNMLREGEKIAVPAAWANQRDEEAQRRELVGQWRDHLAAQQRKALDEEGPSGGFKTRIPLDALKAFTADERDELQAAEEAEYNRLKPLAEARTNQRRAYVQAGGDEEDFDAGWEAGGREMTIAEIADGGKFEPSPGQFASPY